MPNLSFDRVLRLYELMDDSETSDEEKALGAYQLFFRLPDDPNDVHLERLEAILKYVQKRPYQSNSNSENAAGANTDTRRFFSFTEDSEAIFTSFLMLGIDLETKIGQWPWDKFQAVFYNLPEDTPFAKIVSIRQQNPAEMQGREQAELMKMQAAYALPENRSVKGQDDSMEGLFKMMMANAD
ncbi:MAG: Gp15 family bacteriophage protein [Schleiferilactobacillus perolens]